MGWKGMKNYQTRAGGAVTDGPPSRYIPMPVSERHHMGTVTQYGSLNDPGLPLQFHNEGTHPLSWEAHTVPIAPIRGTNQRGPDFHRDPPGGTKTAGKIGETQLVDLGRRMESRQQTSTHMPINNTGPVDPPLPGAPDLGKYSGGPPPIDGNYLFFITTK